METYNLCCPCLFGLESLVSDELKRMSMKDVRAESGRVFFSGSARDVARANISLRCAERVYIVMAAFPASTFDELFEGVKAAPWEELVPRDGAVAVGGHSLKSRLSSVPACQKIVKKSISDRLCAAYKTSWLSETGARFRVTISLMNDFAHILLDTSGDGLHKRGYRAEAGGAPIRETLAAGIVKLSRYRGRGAFFDPFCGSGTILIEAAMIARARAPGLLRRFGAESWAHIPARVWKDVRDEARAGEFSNEYVIEGSDIDAKALVTARSNAKKAGVSDIVRFFEADARRFSRESGVVAANPPYGERMLDVREARELTAAFGKAAAGSGASFYIISSDDEFELYFGRRAVKKRKMYNGMIKCDLYMYF